MIKKVPLKWGNPHPYCADFLLLLRGLLLNLLDLQSRRKRLLKLGSLVRVLEDQGVQVTRATDLELGHLLGRGTLAGRLERGDGLLDGRLLDAGGCASVSGASRSGAKRDETR